MENCQSTIDQAFLIAETKITGNENKQTIQGLQQLVRKLEEELYQPKPQFQDAFFFPNLNNVKKLAKYIAKAEKSIDLCIFSFSNDDLAREILNAHNRGVFVRIITDDEAMKNKGADTQRMADNGIPCRVDSEERYHMHNKFMIVDNKFLVTGSFNWTFQAGKSNQENIIVVDGKFYIDKYVEEFNSLWDQF